MKSYRHSRALLFALPVDWKDQFVSVGCDENLIDSVMKANVIEDYEHLYQIYRRLPPLFRSHVTEPWQLMCMAGEEKAFNYAMNVLNMDIYTKNNLNEMPFHYVVMSGIAAQVDSVLRLAKETDVERMFFSKSANGLNALHYAIFSRDFLQVDAILALALKFKLKILPPVAEKGRNALHFAALTGNPEMLTHVLDLIKGNKIAIKIQDLDDDGFNALNYAIGSNNYNQRNVDLLKSLGLKEGENQDSFVYGGLEKPARALQL